MKSTTQKTLQTEKKSIGFDFAEHLAKKTVKQVFFLKTILRWFRRKKFFWIFFSEMKSATQKTPETKKNTFQLVSTLHLIEQQVKNRKIYRKLEEKRFCALSIIEWDLTHQNRWSGSRNPRVGGTDGRTDIVSWDPQYATHTKPQTRSARSLRPLRVVQPTGFQRKNIQSINKKIISLALTCGV